VDRAAPDHEPRGVTAVMISKLNTFPGWFSLAGLCRTVR